MGTDKNDSPANILFTSVFEHAQYSSPVSRSFNTKKDIQVDVFFGIKEHFNRGGTTYHDLSSLRGEIVMFPYSCRALLLFKKKNIPTVNTIAPAQIATTADN